MHHNFEFNPEIRFLTIDNGIIEPGSNDSAPAVFDSEGCPVSLSLDDNETVNKNIILSTNPVRSEEAVIYAGCFDDNWGFLFVDSISRLWYIMDDGSSRKIAYTLNSTSDSLFGSHTARALELLSYLGITEKKLIKVEEPTRFADIAVPCRSFFHEEFPTYGKKSADAYLKRLDCQINGHPSFFYTSDYHRIFDKIRIGLPERYATTCDKVYFSRRKLKKNKEIGEFALERIFRKNGFAIHYPELLSVSEQIGIVSSCTVLASVEGTLAHNIVFAKPGTRQIVLRKQSEIIPRQYVLCQAMSIQASFVECYSEPFRNIPFSHSYGPFLLVAGKSLKEFCKNNSLEFIRESPVELFGIFAKYCYKCTCLYLKRCAKNILRKKRL